MNPEYIKRNTRVTIALDETKLNDGSATNIEIIDSGTGQAILLSQPYCDEGNLILNIESWPLIRDAIEDMFEEIIKHEPPQT